MTSYSFLLVIAVILLSTKLFGLLSQRVHMPAVVGALVAGILLGPSCFGLIEKIDFLHENYIGNSVILDVPRWNWTLHLEKLKKTDQHLFYLR